MYVVGGSEYTEEDIKQELERLYAAAGYINAESGDMEVAIHLIGAAIAELESLVEQKSQPKIRLVHGNNAGEE